MNEMYSAHVTEVANSKEDLLNGLEFCDWKEAKCLYERRG